MGILYPLKTALNNSKIWKNRRLSVCLCFYFCDYVLRFCLEVFSVEFRKNYMDNILVPCHVPSTANGFYVLSKHEHISATGIILPSEARHILNDSVDIKNGQVVEFSCYPGYNVIVSNTYF